MTHAGEPTTADGPVGDALPGWLRGVLRCPACHGELTDTRDAPDGPGLACVACGRRYPVRDGVPVLLVDEATGGAGEASA